MRTSTQLALVLMGSGVLSAGVAVSAESWRACREARAHNDPGAERSNLPALPRCGCCGATSVAALARGDMAEATVMAAASLILGVLNAACLA